MAHRQLNWIVKHSVLAALIGILQATLICPCPSYADGYKRDIPDLDTLFIEADKGDAKAQYLLGLDYHYGIELKKNDSKAVEAWRRAADQGYDPAEIMLASAYWQGEGVTENGTEAAR